MLTTDESFLIPVRKPHALGTFIWGRQSNHDVLALKAYISFKTLDFLPAMSRIISNKRFHNRKIMRLKITFSLIVGGLPLLIYPGVVLGGLMGLSGVWSGNEPLWLVVVVKSSLIGSISYPLVYFASAVAAVVMTINKRTAIAFKISLIPLAYLLVLGLLFLVWFWLNQIGY